MIKKLLLFLFAFVFLISGVSFSDTVTEKTDEKIDLFQDSSDKELVFSIVCLPDTQNMTVNKYEPVRAAAEWIKEQKENLKILYCVHTGDIVTGGLSNRSWERISSVLSEIRETVPFLTVAGNHDVGRAFNYDFYLKWRPDTPLPEDHLFRNGVGSWTSFDTELGNILIVGMSCFNAKETEPFEWIKNVFDSHPDSIGILVFHDYLLKRDLLSSYGELLYQKVVKACPSVRFVLCGHNGGVAYRCDSLDDDGDGITDRNVHQLMLNHQQDEKINGYFRVLSFYRDHSLRIVTYSAYLDDFNYYINSDTHEFKESFVIEDVF